MQSKLKHFVDNYNKKPFDVKKSKFYLEHLLVYFNVELGFSLETKSNKLKSNISTELLKIKNNVYKGYLLKLYIPTDIALPIDISYKDEDSMKMADFKNNKTILHIEHLYQLLVLEYISVIYNFIENKHDYNGNVDFIYKTYDQLEFIVRTNKLNILFEE